MMVLSITLSLTMIFLTSCGEAISLRDSPSFRLDNSNDNSPLLDHSPEQPTLINSPDEPTQIAPRTFSVQVHGETYTAFSDKSGDVSIVDYPSAWRGKAKIDRVDFEMADLKPFSTEHCERLSRMAQNGMGDFVRSAFHSRLIFEVPPFLALNFVNSVRESAKSMGIEFPITSIKNSVDHVNGVLEIAMNDHAISAVIGNLPAIYEQLNLSQRGGFIDETHKAMLVVSGDVICDLIAGNAQMKMTYVIFGTTKTVDVLYEPLTVDLSLSASN